jgi:sucrose-6-phosphate hydrolase SacC (GH32 family)
MYHWDTWYLPLGDEVHMYHLQVKRPGSRRPNADVEAVGHAVSRDLLRWQEQPVALRKSPPGAYDDGCLFTGYAVEHEGVIYLYYCSNHSENGRGRQAICLATSKDGGRTYQKYAGNPIIEPDAKRYYAIGEPPPPFRYHAHPHIDCRDLAVVKDPAGHGWLGYVVMRRKGQPDALHSACVALCRSQDLVHWEVGDPCCTPNRFNCFEVPDVFQFDGRWYMIALTGDVYGQSQRWNDPEITCATVVFQADRPEGPFQEVRDNLLLASKKNVWQGFSARTVLRKGERLMLFTRCEGVNGRGRLSWPVKLVSRPAGGLLPQYWEGCDRGFGPPRQLSGSTLKSPDALSRKVLETAAGDDVYMLQTVLQVKQGHAGIGFGPQGEAGAALALLAVAEGHPGLVKLTTADGATLADRRWSLAPNRQYRLRLVVVREMVEVYVDDVLAIDFFLPQLKRGRIALVGRGDAAFKTVEYRSGLMDKPAR